MNTPRLIGSRINETSQQNRSDMSGNRSFNLRLGLETNDPRISPIIDTFNPSKLLNFSLLEFYFQILLSILLLFYFFLFL